MATKKWDTSPIEMTIDFVKESLNRANTAQEIGEYPPEKGYKAWAIKGNGEPNKWYTLFAHEAPVVGAKISMRRFVKLEDSGEEKYPKWMLEADYAIVSAAPAGGGGNRGNAPQRNYDIENRQNAAHDATLFKGDKEWDLHTTFTVADAYVEYYKTGKKPDPKPKAPQA